MDDNENLMMEKLECLKEIRSVIAASFLTTTVPMGSDFLWVLPLEPMIAIRT